MSLGLGAGLAAHGTTWAIGETKGGDSSDSRERLYPATSGRSEVLVVARRMGSFIGCRSKIGPHLLSWRSPCNRMHAKTIEVDASHLSLITHPQETVDLILNAAGHSG